MGLQQKLEKKIKKLKLALANEIKLQALIKEQAKDQHTRYARTG
jgi:hypothetical protein